MDHARMRCSELQNLLLCFGLRNKVTIHANISTPQYFRHEFLPSFEDRLRLGLHVLREPQYFRHEFLPSFVVCAVT